MNWSENDLVVLEDLETTVARIWRAHPEMSDYVAQRAYEAAFQFYRAEFRGHTPKPPSLGGLDGTTFDAIKAVCEFRLGRGPSPIDKPHAAEPVSVEHLVNYLRQLVKSVERHTAIDGRQGYLHFIDHYVD